MATLKEAIEKVGVGGIVTHSTEEMYTVDAVGTNLALLMKSNGSSFSARLDTDDWSPVLPKKRVVLQAWATADGCIIWVKEGFTVSAGLLCVRANDIPDMVFEDGKQVFE